MNEEKEEEHGSHSHKRIAVSTINFGAEKVERVFMIHTKVDPTIEAVKQLAAKMPKDMYEKLSKTGGDD